MPIPSDYGQRLPAWANLHYGLPQAAATSTIGEYGCKLCCYALILGKRPDALQEQFAASGVYRAAGTFNFIDDAQIPTLYPQLCYLGRVDCPDTPAPLSQVDALLNQARFLLTYVYVKTQGGRLQHYVLITGKLGSDYQIYDPYHNEIAPITKRYGRTPLQTTAGQAATAICGFIKLIVRTEDRGRGTGDGR